MEHGIQVSDAVLKNHLKPSGENDVVEQAIVEQHGLEVAKRDSSIREEGPLNDHIDNEVDASPFEQRKYLAVAESNLQHHGHLDSVISKAFYDFQRLFRIEMQCKMAQTIIKHHFAKNKAPSVDPRYLRTLDMRIF